MLLSSPVYFVFLAVVFFLYWPVARLRGLALGTLVLANLFFYAKWSLVYLALVPVAASIDFLIGLGLGREERPDVRKLLVAASVALNVGLIASLKYVPFVLETWAWGTGRTAPEWHWTLPLGLSFYAFQALTYTLDIYRRDAQPTRNWLAHLAAVTFFPTTLAGPIAVVPKLLDQFQRVGALLAPAEGGRALFLIGLGLTKKLLIADFLAENLVNRVFDFPKLYSGFEVLVGVYAYAWQLYYDFSGYTDVALGSALLLGLKLPPNFNQPYAAENIGDFWKRWHMSLSSWLQNYLYFSLPGARSKVLPYVNLTVTMAIGGLWHGAAWTFVVWGLLHGVALAVTRWWQAQRGRRRPNPHPALRTLRVLGTFHFVAFAWVFFRAESLGTARDILAQIASLTVSTANIPADFALLLIFCAAVHFVPKSWYERVLAVYAEAPFYVQASAMALLILAIRYVAQTGVAPFVYQRF